MSTTHQYRDFRVALLATAAARVGDPGAALYRAEAALWAVDDWTTADATVEAVALDRLWTDLPNAHAVASDTAFTDAGDISPATDAFLTAYDDLPRGEDDHTGFLRTIRGLLPDDPAYIAFISAVHAAWLTEDPTARAYPFDDIGVLLPLQLETRFQQDAKGGWTVKVRVIPQPPSIDTFDDRLGVEALPDDSDAKRAAKEVANQRGQQAAADTFWRAYGKAGGLDATWLNSADGLVAFTALAKAVGSARAAWIATSCQGAFGDAGLAAQPISTPLAAGRSDRVVGLVTGLPPVMSVRVWTYDADGDERAQEIGRLPQQGAANAAIPSSIPVMIPTPDDVDSNWITSWTDAVDLGLAGEFALPDGYDPTGLGGIVVAGVGDERPADLLIDQTLTGTLQGMSLGAATNSVAGATTAISTTARDGSAVLDGAPDIAAWRAAAVARLTTPAPVARADEEPDDRALHMILGRYLGALLPPFPRPAGIDDQERAESAPTDPIPATGLSRMVIAALWPALWGTSLIERWQLPGDLAADLISWSLQNVSPEGPLPPVRFGTEPYGILPVTTVQTGWFAPNGMDTAGTKWLAQTLDPARRALHRALAPGGTVFGRDGTGLELDSYTDLLLRGGTTKQVRDHIEADYAVQGLDPAAWQTFTSDQIAALGLPAMPPGVPNWMPMSTPQRAWMPLVRPRRAALWGHSGNWFTAPLPWLLDLMYARNGGGFMSSQAQPIDLASLYGSALSASDAGPRDPDLSVNIGDFNQDLDRLNILPASVLVRLLAQSAAITNDWRAGQRAAHLGSLSDYSLVSRTVAVGAEDQQSAAAIALARLIDTSSARRAPMDQVIPGTASGADVAGLPDIPFGVDEDGSRVLDAGREKRLERALGAAIDSAATRIDPWITALAWTRLQSSTDRGARPTHRLGAYGWVTGPFNGTPGPTESGFIHTPSHAKTITATLLRDRFRESLATKTVSDTNTVPWDMRLTSTSVRLAEAIARDLRDGLHLYDVVGREVERILGGATDQYERIETLRTTYPMYDDKPSPHVVCNGILALAVLLDPTAKIPDVLVPDDAEREQLHDLRNALDALADLTLIDGVLHSTERRPAPMAAAMNAAAGDSPVPSFTFPHTDPSGFLVETAALAVIPAAAAPPNATSATLAEPSVAALLTTRYPDPWTFTVAFEDGSAKSVELAEVGFAPIESLGVADSRLSALAAAAAGARRVTIRAESSRSWTVTNQADESVTVTTKHVPISPAAFADLTETAQRDILGKVAFPDLPAGSEVTVEVLSTEDTRLWSVWDELGGLVGLIDPDDAKFPPTVTPPVDERDQAIRIAAGCPAVVSISAPVQLAAARRLCATLGAPASERDLAPSGAPSPSTKAAYDEMAGRYGAVHSALTDLAADGAKAIDDTSKQPDFIREAARWGFTADADPTMAATFTTVMLGKTEARAGAASIAAVTKVTLDAVHARLSDALDPGSIPQFTDLEPGSHDPIASRSDGTPDGIRSLARAISALAAPQANLPVLITWKTERLQEVVSVAENKDLDDEWLTVVAPVRSALARLEAVQLGDQPLTAWSSSRDPWLTAEIAAQQDVRAQTPELTGTPRLRVVYAAGPALDAASVAVGVIDSFSEAVPAPHRATHAAFGFNAPSARAPQAVLLAVPPADRQRIDDDMLHRILGETRELMVARTATTETMVGIDAIMSTIWLPGDNDPTVPAPFDTGAYMKAQ